MSVKFGEDRYLVINSIIPNRWVRIQGGVVTECSGKGTKDFLGMTAGSVKSICRHYNLGRVWLADILNARGLKNWRKSVGR